jgi:hypothetical protein
MLYSSPKQEWSNSKLEFCTNGSDLSSEISNHKIVTYTARHFYVMQTAYDDFASDPRS